MSELILQRDFFAPQRRERLPVAPGSRLVDVVPQDFPLDRARVIANGRLLTDKDIVLSQGDVVVCRVVPFEAGLVIGLIGLGLSLIGTGISYGMQYLQARRLKNDKNYDNSEQSPTYSWEGVQNTTRNGEPIGLVYGKHRVGGQYLCTYTDSLTDGKHRLNFLLGLGAGPIGGINDRAEDSDDLTLNEIATSLLINKNAANAFSNLSVYYRMGNWDQSVIDGFRDIPKEFEPGNELAYNSAVEYTTTEEVTAVDLRLVFPDGIYQTTNSGGFAQYKVVFLVEYKEYSGSTWTTAGTYTVSPVTTRSEFVYFIKIPELPSSRYVFRITRQTLDDASVTGTYPSSQSRLGGVVEKTYDDVAYKGIALMAGKAIANEQLNGRLPEATNIVYGKKCTVYQPHDDFGPDTEQWIKEPGSPVGDGARFWGWYVENTDNLDFARTNFGAFYHLYLGHAGAATQWTGYSPSTHTAPYVYKRIYGDFDLRCKLAFNSEPGNGDYIALMLRPHNYPGNARIGLKRTSDYYISIYDHLLNGSSVTFGEAPAVAATSTTNYFRITKTTDTVGSSTFTFYSSTDGTTWTSRYSGYFVHPHDSEYIEIGFVLCSPLGGSVKGYASEMTFADSTCYSVETTSNPSWVVYDLLTDTHYALGGFVGAASIDLDTFIDFAAYCNDLIANGKGQTHRRFRFDGVLDSSKAAWDVVVDILSNYRAAPLKQGDRVRIAWQRPQDPVQLFAMSNIKEGSFSVTYQTPLYGPNYWEMQYLNDENDYEQDYAVYVDPDMDDGETYRRKTVAIYGVTRSAEAYRAALYNCKLNRYTTKRIKFETGIEAIACEPYDVITIQHDIMGIGVGVGRVISSSSTSVTLDKTVTLAEDYIYVVRIRHKGTDTPETQTITSGAGTHSVLSVAGWTNRPEPSAVYVVGRQNIVTQDYLVTRIARTNDLDCEIEALEYNAGIYDDAVESIPDVKYSEFEDPRKVPDNVSGHTLKLSERAQLMSDGTVTNVVDVTFGGANGAQSYEIWYRLDTSTDWVYGGFTRTLHYILVGTFVTGLTYHIAVVSVGPYGAKRTPDLSPYGIIEIVGRNTLPPDVTSITYARVGSVVYLRWSEVVTDDLLGYRVRHGATAVWDDALDVTGVMLATHLETTDFAPGERYFLVKAINRSGLYSANAASVQETVTSNPDENYVIERYEATESWPGTDSNMTETTGVMVLDAGQTTGYYETPEIDTTVSVVATLKVAPIVESTDSTAVTWATATYAWNSAWGQATRWQKDPSNPFLSYQVSYRCGDNSGNLGSYINAPANTMLMAQGTGRYWQVKVTLTVGSVAYSAKINNIQTTIDPPEFIQRGHNEAVSGSGTTSVVFPTAYHITPNVHTNPVDGAAGDNAQVTNRSTTGFDVTYVDIAGDQTAGYIDWVAVGY